MVSPLEKCEHITRPDNASGDEKDKYETTKSFKDITDHRAPFFVILHFPASSIYASWLARRYILLYSGSQNSCVNSASHSRITDRTIAYCVVSCAFIFSALSSVKFNVLSERW